MSARSRHSVHQARDTNFQTEAGDVTLHADTFVDKAKLYTLKRKILAGKTDLDIETYRHFILRESGQIDPITENWALRESSFSRKCTETVPGPNALTLNEARTLVSGDRVEWSDGTVGVVGFDPKNKTCVSYVNWPDGQRTLLNDPGALPRMRVVSKSTTVNGLPR